MSDPDLDRIRFAPYETGACTERRPGCNGGCCNCDDCVKLKGRRNICAFCARAIEQEKALLNPPPAARKA